MCETVNDPSFLPYIIIMHNMRDYFLTILCTCLKNILNNIYVNINFDFLSFLYFCSNFKISQFLFSVGIYEDGILKTVNEKKPLYLPSHTKYGFI